MKHQRAQKITEISGALRKALGSYAGSANTELTRIRIKRALVGILGRIVGMFDQPIDIKFDVVESEKNKIVIVPGNDATAALLESLNSPLGRDERNG